MQALRVILLLVTVAICYLLFFHSQTKTGNETSSDLANPDLAALSSPTAAPGVKVKAHDQYKEAMDRAHAAAKSMQDERKEADSY